MDDVVGAEGFSGGVSIVDNGTGNRMSDLNTNIANTAAAYKPGMLSTVKAAMDGISNIAYNKRQAKEYQSLSGEFDPQKVGGSTFSSIMKGVESRRGGDVSRVAAGTMQAYQTSQAEIGSMYKQLTAERTQLQESARDFKYKMAAEYPGLYDSLSKSEKRSLDSGEPSSGVFKKFDKYTTAAKEREDAWIAEQRAMEVARFNKSMQPTGSASGRAASASATKTQQTLDFIKGIDTEIGFTFGAGGKNYGSSFISDTDRKEYERKALLAGVSLSSVNTYLDTRVEPSSEQMSFAEEKYYLEQANQPAMLQQEAVSTQQAIAPFLNKGSYDMGALQKMGFDPLSNPAHNKVMQDNINAGHQFESKD